jgi:superfamily II DNA or RNA helicase
VVEALGQPGAARALVFCGDGEARQTCADLLAAGWRAEVLAADTRHRVRETQRERLTSGELQALVTVDCATKGWDCPAVDTVVVARAVQVTGLYLQMVGRALRPSPSTGKTRARVLDLRGVTWLHGLPEWDRVWSLEGQAAGDVREACRTGLTHCATCGWIGLRPGAKEACCPMCAAMLAQPRRQKHHRSALQRMQGLPVEEMRAQIRESTYHAVLRRMLGAGKAEWLATKIATKAAEQAAERVPG